MLLAAMAIVFATYTAKAQIVSDFSVDADGWIVADQSVASPAVVTWNATNGNPGGYVSANIGANGNNRFWWAPAKFMGNRAYTSFGETLSFDVQTSTAAPEHSAVGDLMLSNGFQSIYLNLVSLPGQAPGWTHYEVKLDETANWKLNGIGASTAGREAVIAVLTNLQQIRIFMQWKFAINITGGLDNVVMGVHPPAAPAPVITSVSSFKSAPGTSVTITGTNFGATAAENLVYFGGVKGQVESGSPTQIVVKVPMSADHDRLKVVNLATQLSGRSIQYFVPIFATGGGATIIPGSFDKYTQYNRVLGHVTHGDINGDGKNELVMANGNFISIFENISTAGTIDATSFGPRLDLSPSAAGGYSEIKMDDLDSDGKLDIFVAIRDAPDAGRIVVLRNTHTSGPITGGSFGPFIDVTLPPYTLSSAHSADLDGDGRPDLIGWGSSCGPNPVYVLLNISTPGDIKFTTQYSLSGISTCSGRFQTSDLDGDGKTDIIQSGESNTRIFRNTSIPGTLSFEAPFDFGTGNGGDLTTIGDLDSDGKPEVVFAQGGLNIYKNISTPGSLSMVSFTGVTVIPGAINIAKIADLNGDGKPDILSTVNGGLAVYQNVTPDGQINLGSFRPYVTIDAGGSAATNLDVADFDFDGRPDLVSNNGGFSNVAVVRNATTAPPTITSLSAKAAPPGATITITGANFIASTAGNIVWFGNARATVSNATSTALEVMVPIGASYDQVSVASNGFTIYSKDFFTPTFSGGSDFTASSLAAPFERAVGGISSLEVGDFDADGKIDILSDNNSSTAVLRNIGTPGTIDANTFAPNYSVGNAGSTIQKGDFDGDGMIDLAINTVMARNVSSSALPDPIAFDTYLTRDQQNPTVAAFNPFRDLNNDGKIDISFTGTIAVAHVQGNKTRPGPFLDYGSPIGSFATNVGFSRPVGGGSSVVADFDEDGFNDMITTNPANNSMSVFLNQKHVLPISSSLFNGGTIIAAGTAPAGIVAADFDNDGKPDIAVTNNVNSAAATISIFRNTSVTGAISFARQDFPAAPAPVRIVAADMDGDGLVDLVVTNQGTTANSFSIFRNRSTVGVLDANSFAARTDYATITSPRALAVADIDGDMRPEVILTRVTANVVSVFKNLVPLGPNISFTKQPVNSVACENGSTTYSIIATGASNLSYAWQQFNTTTSQFENLSADNNVTGVSTPALTISNITASMNGSIYRCKVSGDGAADKFSDQAVLTTSASPAAPTASGASACKGSSLTLTAMGGIDGNYRWYDSQVSQQAIDGQVNSSFATPVIFATKTYYVAIANASGCVSARTEAIAAINPISKPVITSTGTLLCGVNEVTIFGPAGFAAYNWSNNESTQDINVSFQGSYALIVEDANGCSSLPSDPIVVTAGSVSKPVIEASKSKLCSADDEIILSGPAGFEGYEWSNGETTSTLSVTDAGVFSLIVVNDSGCRSESSDDFEVEIGAEIPTISVGTDVLVSTPAKTYQWYYGDFKIPEGTKQFLKYNPFQYGAYSVAVTDAADCATTSAVFVNLVTEVEHLELNDVVYPNPFMEILVMNADVDEARLFDATGKPIKTLIKGENDVSHLARGLYLLRLRNGNELKTIKVSK